MKPSRRHIISLVGSAVALPAVWRRAFAQVYPARPVHWIVGFTAGGASDIFARLVGRWLTDRFGQQFVIENRPGAGTNIATESVVRAAPDGYTLLLSSPANAINATLYERLNFNFIRDIAPVASLAGAPNVMVVSSAFPTRTLAEFIGYAKANPGKVTMASSGVGASSHLSGELLKMMAGIDMVHVPYRGAAQALTDLLGGQVQVMFSTVPPAIEYVKAGRLRALAVTTARRLETLPDVPSIGEFVPSYESSAWWGVGAPKDTPTVIIDRLNREINAGLVDPTMRARFLDLGVTPLIGSPADFGRMIIDETEKWGRVVKFAGLRPE
jgi:tripartite-type tricarboxylate transporter receptor subunit TctC